MLKPCFRADEMTERLDLDSSNSSKPPSSDGLKKRRVLKSLRRRSSAFGVLRFKRLYPAHQRGDELFDVGRNNHPTLDSEIGLRVSHNRKAANNQTPSVTFRTRPALAVTSHPSRREGWETERAFRGLQGHKTHEICALTIEAKFCSWSCILVPHAFEQ
jgi:hypothetical protein